MEVKNIPNSFKKAGDKGWWLNWDSEGDFLKNYISVM